MMQRNVSHCTLHLCRHNFLHDISINPYFWRQRWNFWDFTTIFYMTSKYWNKLQECLYKSKKTNPSFFSLTHSSFVTVSLPWYWCFCASKICSKKVELLLWLPFSNLNILVRKFFTTIINNFCRFFESKNEIFCFSSIPFRDSIY